MAYLSSLTSEELHHYTRAIAHSVTVRTHLDALVWLQGDMQRYIPHDIMVAAWGDFRSGAIRHDIITSMVGVRSQSSNPRAITPVLDRLFQRWSAQGRAPFALHTGERGFLLEDDSLTCALSGALQKMRSAMVHGISDERGSHDCLYVTYSSKPTSNTAECEAMALVLPNIDSALRQVKHLPHQSSSYLASNASTFDKFNAQHELKDDELEILEWVAMGKTNPEIGSILDLSEFTVKNRLQRVFKRLNVCNRAQAVAKFLNHA